MALVTRSVALVTTSKALLLRLFGAEVGHSEWPFSLVPKLPPLEVFGETPTSAILE